MSTRAGQRGVARGWLRGVRSLRARRGALARPPGRSSSAPGQRRYHFHAPGLAYVIVTIVLAVGAINSQNNLLFSALGLALGGLLASGLISGASLLGVRIERRVLGPAAVGEPLRIRYAVTNTNRFLPVFGLAITEATAPAPARARWPWVRRGRSARPSREAWTSSMPAPRVFVVHVGPGETVHTEATVVPFRRGRVALAGVVAITTFPFGLARKSLSIVQPAVLLIRPRALALKPSVLELPSARAEAGVGSAPAVGRGDEFYALREYREGDHPRHIAWRPSARADRLVVRQHASPAPRRLLVWLDLHVDDLPEPAARDRQERAIALAASIVRGAEAQGLAVGLRAPMAALDLPPREGAAQRERILDALAMVRLDGPSTAAAAAPPAVYGARGTPVIAVHAGAAAEGPGPRRLSAAALEDHLRPEAGPWLAADGAPGDGRFARRALWRRLWPRRAADRAPAPSATKRAAA